MQQWTIIMYTNFDMTIIGGSPKNDKKIPSPNPIVVKYLKV